LWHQLTFFELIERVTVVMGFEIRYYLLQYPATRRYPEPAETSIPKKIAPAPGGNTAYKD
jgi:hypothetical protein